MEQLFVPQSPPENATPGEFNAYLNRAFRDIAQNFETIADGRTIEKRHVAPSKPRDGMVVYADGTNWNPGSGEGFYQRVNGAWVGALLLTGGTMTGNIAMSGAQTVDGRDLSADGTKLDGIENGAEVNPAVVPQAEAEAGTATTERIWTAQRVKQAIDALGGQVVQVVNVMDSAVATGTTVLPYDDTIPQNTEGDEYMTLAITPTNSSNKLKIDVVAELAHTTTTSLMIAALFQDSTANALAAMNTAKNGTGDNAGNVSFTHYMTAGTTSPTTFKVRCGNSNSGTTTFNGTSGARRFGGVMASSITITEIKV